MGHSGSPSFCNLQTCVFGSLQLAMLAATAPGPSKGLHSAPSGSEEEAPYSPPAPTARRASKAVQERVPDNILAILVGVPDGRWAPELGRDRGSHQWLAAKIALIAPNRFGTFTRQDDLRVLGFALFKGWEVVSGAPRTEAGLKLTQASRATHTRRSCPVFLEHEVIFAVDLGAPGIAIRGDPLAWSDASEWIPRQLHPEDLDRALRAPCHLTCYNGKFLQNSRQAATGADMLHSLTGLTREAAERALVAWPAWAPVAGAIAMGVCAADVTAIYNRTSVSPAWAPVDFSRRQLQHVRKLNKGQPPMSDTGHHPAPGRPEGSHCKTAKGCVQPYKPVHLVNAAAAGMFVGSQAKLNRVSISHLRFWYPLDWQSRLLEQNWASPSRWTLERARVRVDITAMLLRREWYRESRPTYRYVAYDASPQPGGVEVFCTTERVILAKDVAATSPGDFGANVPVDIRRLPLSVLGHGRCSLADKVQTHVHQTWLDYGPSVLQVHQAMLDVRQCLSDMGTEIGVADYPDVVELSLTGLNRVNNRAGAPSESKSSVRAASKPSTALVKSASAYLFPLALSVPGPQHILDVVMREVLEGLPFWPHWQAQAKVVCQWLSSEGHRHFLQEILGRLGAVQLRGSLSTSCDRFVAWRWQTISNVTRDLGLKEEAIRVAMGTLDGPDQLGTRDAPKASACFSAIKDPTFWSRARALRQCTLPLSRLSSWVRGCDCHQELLEAGKDIQCPWKGCRTRSLSARIRSFEQEISELRDAAAAGPDSGSPMEAALTSGEAVTMLTRMLSLVRFKFAWVSELPYLIWQVDSPGAAKSFLEQHDALLALGRTPHRVSSFFAGESSPLRADMESLAAGRGWSSRLWQEVRSYQYCMLDDSWVEGAHRDVSRISNSARQSKMSWRFASVRREQSMAAVLSSGLSHTELDRASLCFKMWKRIGQPAALTHRGPPRPMRRATPATIVREVYRLHTKSRVAWSPIFAGMVASRASGKCRSAKAEVGVAAALKVDYISQVLASGSPTDIYSFPDAFPGVAERALAGSLAAAADILDQGSSGAVFFQAMPVGRRKRLAADEHPSHDPRCMLHPVMLQKFSLSTRSNAGAAPSCCVHADGLPHQADAVSLHEWPVLRAGLRRWKVSPSRSDIQGCITVTGGEVVSQLPWDIRKGPVPVLVLLDQLMAEGWEVRTGKLARSQFTEHGASSPKVAALDMGKCMTAGPYLRCLLLLHELLSARYTALPAGQIAGYYECVLASDDPQSVPLHRAATLYTEMLKSEARLAQADDSSSSGPDSQGSSEEKPMAAHGSTQSTLPGQPWPPAKRARCAQQATESSTIQGALWRTPLQQPGVLVSLGSSSSSGQPALTVATPAIPEAGQGHPAPSVGASGPQPAASPDQPLLATDADAAQPEEPKKRKRRTAVTAFQGRREILAVVDGQQIYKDEGRVGQPGHYIRAIIGCGHQHHEGALPCGKSRTFCAAHTSAYGDKEPVAYLAAWHRAGALCESKAAHAKHKPTLADIEAVIREGVV